GLVPCAADTPCGPIVLAVYSHKIDLGIPLCGAVAQDGPHIALIDGTALYVGNLDSDFAGLYITWGFGIECQAKGIEDGRLARSRRSRDGKDARGTQGLLCKVDIGSPLQRSEVSYTYGQYLHATPPVVS